MTGFAYRLDKGQAEAIGVREAVSVDARLVWVHLETNDAVAQRWLHDSAHLPDYVVDALTATETRPRCEAVGEGAFLNLRGRSSEPLDGSDMLASVRIWAVKGRVYSVTRRPLLAVDEVRQCVERGEVVDPGDLITAFATAITSDLDPDVASLGDDKVKLDVVVMKRCVDILMHYAGVEILLPFHFVCGAGHGVPRQLQRCSGAAPSEQGHAQQAVKLLSCLLSCLLSGHA